MRGETCTQVTTNGKGFSHFHPILRKGNAHEALAVFINEYGVMEHLVTDGAKEQGSRETYKGNWNKLIKHYGIHQCWTQPHCWWMNLAEMTIGQIRREMRTYRRQSNNPKRLWAFLGWYVTGKRNRTTLPIPTNAGRSGFEIVTGRIPDITLYSTIGWYQWVWWLDHKDGGQKIGSNLRPAGNGYGGGDCYFVLTFGVFNK